MTGSPEKPKGARPLSEADERARRLRDALRANLQRRKAQSRARDADGVPGPDDDTDDKE